MSRVAGDSLALACEEGLLVVLGKQEAQPRVLAGLQHAPEQVASQARAPQRHCACQEEALGGLKQPQAVRAAAGCMSCPGTGYEGSRPLHTQHACVLNRIATMNVPLRALHVYHKLHESTAHELACGAQSVRPLHCVNFQVIVRDTPSSL